MSLFGWIALNISLYISSSWFQKREAALSPLAAGTSCRFYSFFRSVRTSYVTFDWSVRPQEFLLLLLQFWPKIFFQEMVWKGEKIGWITMTPLPPLLHWFGSGQKIFLAKKIFLGMVLNFWHHDPTPLVRGCKGSRIKVQSRVPF